MPTNPSSFASLAEELGLNPHLERLRNLELSIADLVQRKAPFEQELEWFRSVDRKSLVEHIADSEATHVELSRALLQRQQDVGEIAIVHRKAVEPTKSALHPMYWFSQDQREIRKIRRMFWEQARNLVGDCIEQAARLEELKSEIDKAHSTLAKYDSFDEQATRTTIDELNNAICSTRSDQYQVAQLKLRVDCAIRPILKKLFENRSSLDEQNAKRSQATRLESELQSARNGYERACVHEKCERAFETGSPRSVIKRCDQRLRQLERDRQKTISRAREVARRASRDIGRLVIDGNNLCYSGREFIGMAALKAVMPLLSSDIDVVVVFDASIRRKMSSLDQELEQHFRSDVQIHVVATRQRADETLLQLAEQDQSTFVLSNDRFAEFDDMSCVKEDRVIRHEILAGSVFIHELGVQAQYYDQTDSRTQGQP